MKLVPERIFGSISEITPEVVRNEGVKGLVLDIDNTMASKRIALPDETLINWIASLKQADIRLFIISNNWYSRVSRFAAALDVPFIHFGLKPFPFSFIRAVRLLGLRREEVAAVGDQIYTDVCGAHSAGIRAWLVMPIDRDESFSFLFRRRLEKPVIAKYYRTSKGDHP